MRRCSTEFRLKMKVTADNLKAAILSRVWEVWERKVLDRIEPTDALIIKDNIYLAVFKACTLEEFRAVVRERAEEGLVTIHETATDTGLRLPIEESEL